MGAVAILEKPDLTNNPQDLSYVLFWGYMKWLVDQLDNADERSLFHLWMHDSGSRRLPFNDARFSEDRLDRIKMISEVYRGEVGGKIAKLNLLIRELHTDTIDNGLGDQIEQLLGEIENHPLISRTRSVHKLNAGYHHRGSTSSYLDNFRSFRELIRSGSVNEFNHPEYRRVSFQALVEWCRRLVLLTEPGSRERLSKAILNELELRRWHETQRPKGRLLETVKSVAGDLPPATIDKIFDATIADLDKSKAGWLFHCTWYFNWCNPSEKDRMLQFLKKYEDDIKASLMIRDPHAVRTYVPYFHAYMARKYLEVGLRDEARQWLSAFEKMEAMDARRSNPANTRDEHTMVAGRVYLAAYLLSEGNPNRADELAESALSRAEGQQIRINRHTMELIAPHWRNQDFRNASEAALLVRKFANDTP